jgi:hypothetical protein
MNIDKLLASLTEEQRRELQEALEWENEGGAIKDNDPSPTAVGEDFRVKNRKAKRQRRSAVKGGKNKWKDTGEFQDITTPDFERTERRRSAPKKTIVSCHMCGKEFKVNQSLVYGEFHRCNKCTGR